MSGLRLSIIQALSVFLPILDRSVSLNILKGSPTFARVFYSFAKQMALDVQRLRK